MRAVGKYVLMISFPIQINICKWFEGENDTY